MSTPFQMSWEETGARRLLVHHENSLSERCRRRRWTQVLRHVPDLATLRVLDLGGTGTWWANAPVRPRAVTAINLHDADQVHPSVEMIEGDVLEADRLVRGREFDLVFSNSLIEHLGGHRPRRRFAELVAALAPRHVIQTPYRYFPIEPHWLFPGFQFLPMGARSRLAPRWKIGMTYGWDPRAAADEVMATELLTVAEIRAYFPDSQIVFERIGGVPKSMLAIRGRPSRARPAGATVSLTSARAAVPSTSARATVPSTSARATRSARGSAEPDAGRDRRG